MTVLVLVRACLPPRTQWIICLITKFWVGLSMHLFCRVSLWCPSLLHSEEVSYPKTINIKQCLNTNNFSVNNKHFVIKSSQSTQLYITNVFYKQFSCRGYIKISFFVRYFDKINIFWCSSITRLNNVQHDTSDILFSLFKMTFNLKGSVDQEFSFIVKIKKEKHFL